MTQTIKPIETEYNSYRFRSRLEARWAVFFDAAGIKYEYKPDGFELSCGKYLPDFYLPDYQVYVEIKPFDKSIVSQVGDRNKWEWHVHHVLRITAGGEFAEFFDQYADDNLNLAKKAARQARFEYGETPKGGNHAR